MIGVQISCERKTWMKTASWWAKGSIPVMLLAVLVALSGCHKYIVVVDVPVKPKFIPPGNIKEFKVHAFEGPAECAKDLEQGIYARAANAKDLAPTIPELPDLDGPLEVKGKVDACSMRMGYGMLNATMMLSHGGNQLYHEIVREETNRPGASSEEVRATLVERVIKQFASIFVPGKKPEIREIRPQGSSDSGWIAISGNNKNWKLAIEFWSKRISEEPKDDRAWYNRGIAHEGLWEFREAVADYKKAVELERDELYMHALVRSEKTLQNIMVIEAAKKSRE
jgi:tetratricopeptide (TPR) repeat protein